MPLHDTDRSLSRHVTVLMGQRDGKYPDGNSVVVAGSEGAVVIDPSLTVAARGGVPAAIDRVLISHAHEDHMAGIASLQSTGSSVGSSVGSSAGSPVSVHAHHADLIGVQTMDGLMDVYGLGGDDSAWRNTVATEFNFDGWPDAQGFDDGDVFDLGGVSVRVLHLAGHTRGHSAFMIEPDGVLFVGDVDLSTFGPYYGDHWSDLDEFVASIARVREVAADHYVTFHHKGIVDGRDEFVRQLDAFASVIDRRDAMLLELLRQPRPFEELVANGIVYRAGSRPPMFGDSVEARSIEAHLARLQRRGLVVTTDDGYAAS